MEAGQVLQCRTYGTDVKSIHNSGETVHVIDHLEDVVVDGKITLRWMEVDWICLSQDRDQWRPLANMLMNFLVQ
jgi:hypothetical protein